MARELIISDPIAGPSGEEIVNYITENVPALWDVSAEVITEVTNTGAQYVGEVEGLVDFPQNKLFWFRPHVNNVGASELSINAGAFLPLRRSDNSPVETGDFLADNYYLLIYNGSTYRLIYDSTVALESREAAEAAAAAAAQSAAEAAASALTLLGNPRNEYWLVIGQSNPSIVRDLLGNAYTPTVIQEWNWGNLTTPVAADVNVPGTAYEDLPDDKVNYAWEAAARMVRDHPNYRIKIVRVTLGGLSADHWLWLKYTFRTATGVAPAAGEVNINNADPSLANLFRIHDLDSQGVSRIAPQTLMATANLLRIEKADDPAVYIEYDPTNYVDIADYATAPLIFIRKAGTIADGTPVKIYIGPNMYDLTVREAALALPAGVKFDKVIVGQGEADAVFPQTWVQDWKDIRQRFITDGFVTEHTPWTFMGMVDSRTNGITAHDSFAVYQQLLVRDNPTVFSWVEVGHLGTGNFQDASFLHLTALGHQNAGGLLYDTMENGRARNAIVNPVTKQMMVPAIADANTPDLALHASTHTGIPTGLKDGGGGVVKLFGAQVSHVREGSTVWNIEGVGATQLTLRRHSDDIAGGTLVLGKARGVATAVSTAVLLNDTIGTLSWSAYTGVTARIIGSIFLQMMEAAPDDTKMGGFIQLACCPVGSIVNTAVLRADHTNGLWYKAAVFLNGSGNHINKVYTVLTKPASGVIGEQITLSDGAGSKRLALWDAVASNWKYPDGVNV